jgi:hypothetical protein
MRERYQQARTFQEFLDGAQANRELWHQIYRRARIPREIEDAARALPRRLHLLVMTEDWCGDAVHSVPYVARLAEAAPQLSVRVVGRDDNPDLMDAHLTDGTRSIPVVMILDEDFRELAWWGPRPQLFKEFFLKELKHLDCGDRFPGMRAWYAKDQGRAVLRELMAAIQGAAVQGEPVGGAGRRAGEAERPAAGEGPTSTGAGRPAASEAPPPLNAGA